MLLAARDPERNESWINTMIGIQLIDWISTLAVLVTGTLALRNVTSAVFLPPLFIAALVWWHPRRLHAARDRRTADSVDGRPRPAVAVGD
jgi:hypothetical protein